MKTIRVLITCGPTWVPIDDIRVISNISSGQLGQEIARNFKKAGAQVTLIEGPVNSFLKEKGIKTIKFRFYDELLETISTELTKKYDVVLHLAAVADYQLKKTFRTKISSRLNTLKLELVPTRKIINIIKKKSPHTFLVGFKLESSLSKPKILEKAKELIQKAKCDLVVVNMFNQKKYQGCIVNQKSKIIDSANSREKLAQNLIKAILQRL